MSDEILTRRQLCEDCEFSRGNGVGLCCPRRYATPCALNSAVRKAEFDCPRGDEWAAEWKMAPLEETPPPCTDRQSYQEQVAALRDAQSEIVMGSVAPSVIRAAGKAVHRVGAWSGRR